MPHYLNEETSLMDTRTGYQGFVTVHHHHLATRNKNLLFDDDKDRMSQDHGRGVSIGHLCRRPIDVHMGVRFMFFSDAQVVVDRRKNRRFQRWCTHFSCKNNEKRVHHLDENPCFFVRNISGLLLSLWLRDCWVSVSISPTLPPSDSLLMGTLLFSSKATDPVGRDSFLFVVVVYRSDRLSVLVGSELRIGEMW